MFDPNDEFSSMWTIEALTDKGWIIVWSSQDAPNLSSTFLKSFMSQGAVRIMSPTRPTVAA